MKRKIVLRNSPLIGLFTVLLAVPLLSQQAPVGGSGTTNYIPIWTTSTNLGDSAFYQKGGRVGLGTTAPLAKLEVVGSRDNTAVYGIAPLYGVWGNTGTGDGVHGTTSAVNTGSGVAGISTGGNVGVYGAVSGCSTGSQCLAGRFDGNVFVNGHLSKSSGGFKIDHPLDPANQYLSHSFVESPDMMNIYNGVVMLDTEGETWVKLPEYFEALNNDFRYQLTAIGAPGPNLYIAKEISGNIFKIGGGRAGSKVSWQVTGVRHDAYADATESKWRRRSRRKNADTISTPNFSE